MGIIMNLEEVATLVLVECPREVIFHPCEVFRQDRQMETSTRDKISTNIVLEDVLASSGWILDTAEKNHSNGGKIKHHINAHSCLTFVMSGFKTTAAENNS